MAEPKTRQTAASVAGFLKSIGDDDVRRDCVAIARIMEQATKSKGKMWGSSIVGFGTYTCTYANGRQADWMITAFSPRKTNITLYLSDAFEERPRLLAGLGKHTTGKSCVYIKRLSDVHLPTLRKLVQASVRHTRKSARKTTS